jgi:VanZ family protein
MFCSTHLPKLKLEVQVRAADKIAHGIAYALLAFLFWRFVETFQRPLSGRFVWIALLWITAYGALDEWLQPYVNRSGDVLDWVYDTLGAAAILALLEWRRRRAPSPRPSRPLDSSAPKR